MARRVRLLAPAKVNLTLDVLGRRADGYHELASVMATVDLCDDVRIGPARGLDVRIRPPILPGGPAILPGGPAILPGGPPVGAAPGDDLATRAARAIAAASGREPRVHVLVRKRIPVAGGLGGGSSDAGAVLRGLAELWGLHDLDLTALGATVGSDVPFFASGHPLARIGGRGERVEPLGSPADPPPWIALVTLPARVATRDVFEAHGGARGDARATDELTRILAQGSASPRAIRALARNDLAAAAERVCPLVAAARAAARDRGIDLVVTGSGPSLFAIADDRAHAIRMSRALRRAGLRARPHLIGISTRPLRG